MPVPTIEKLSGGSVRRMLAVDILAGVTGPILKVFRELPHRLAHRQSLSGSAARRRGHSHARRSGNAGGTECASYSGKSFAIWVMIIDIGKGHHRTRLIAPASLQVFGIPDGSFGGELAASDLSPWLPAACGFAGDHRPRLSHLVRIPGWQGRGHTDRRGVGAGPDTASRSTGRVADRRDAVRLRQRGFNGRVRIRCDFRCSQWHAAAGAADGVRYRSHCARRVHT